MRKYFYIIICAFLSVLFAVDTDVFKQNLQNDIFRIDIIGTNNSFNMELMSFEGMKVEKPSWCKDCVSSNSVFLKDKNKVTGRIKTIKDDTVTIFLKGKYKLKNNTRIPIFVTYKDFIIDGKMIQKDSVDVWHDKPYKQEIKMKAGQVLEFSVIPQKTRMLNYLSVLRFDVYAFFLYFCISLLICIIFIKSNKQRNESQKLDSVFLWIFVCLLFIPMLHISKAEKSDQENRVLAIKPELFVNDKINEKYGTKFEQWFNDRFNGRDVVIKFFSGISYNINNVYKTDKVLLVKNNGWMFHKVKSLRIPEKTDVVKQNLKKFDDFCKQHNMKLYVLLVPSKEAIYSDILRKNYAFDENSVISYNKYIADVSNVLKNNVVYPYDELKKAKEQDFVFFKQSHHWTEFGAFVGYNLLSQKIKKDFKDYNIVSLDQYEKSFSNRIRDDWDRAYNTGHTTRLLNLSGKRADKVLDTEYTYYDNKNTKNITEKRSKYTKDFKNNDKKSKYKMLLIGNSQNENMLQFLPYSVKNLKYIRLNMGQHSEADSLKVMKYYKQDILDYKPDIVILSVSSSLFDGLMNDFYKD